MDEPDGVIEARFLARRQLAPTLAVAAIAVASACLWYVDQADWWLLLLVTEFGALAVLGVVVSVRSRRSGWVLRLDRHGVTVRGADPVAWTDLTQVVSGPVRPFPAFTTGRWMEVVAFMPRAGVELPGPPHYRGTPQRWGAWLRRRFYGTNLTVLPQALSVSAEEMLDAARSWGGLEVRRARRWGWFGLLLFLLACTLLGGVLGLLFSVF